MLSEQEREEAPRYWNELQQLAVLPGNESLRLALRRAGNDPSIQTILELYAEHLYGVRPQAFPRLICNGGPKGR